MKEYAAKQPSPWVSVRSVLPLAVLTLLLYVVIRCFGGDAINGGSQIALLSATSVCVMLAIGIYRCFDLEQTGLLVHCHSNLGNVTGIAGISSLHSHFLSHSQ